MKDGFTCPGYDNAVLYSDDDYEPYGYTSLQLAPVEESGERKETDRSGDFEREIEAAVLSRLGGDTGC